MSYPIVITMRYSVLTKGTESFNISRDHDFDEYKRKLYDPTRLEHHFNLFASITLPSLIGQLSGHNAFKLCILIGKELPETHKEKLYQETSLHDWIKIIEIDEDESITHNIYLRDCLDDMGFHEGVYAHVRLDDDDALCKSYLNKMRDYMKQGYLNCAISFSNGLLAVYDEKKKLTTKFFAHKNTPFIALGLAYIGRRTQGITPKSIYSCGNHTQISQKIPTLVDGTFLAYIRSIYSMQDTKGGGIRNATELTQSSNVLNDFSINAAWL